MAGPTPREREFVGRMGLFFELLGAPRTMGLLYGWLMISEPPRQSITELAAALGVSKASVSTVIRQLEQAQMVERVPMPDSRQHHYQLKPGGWAQIMRARVTRLRPGAQVAEYGLSIIGADRPAQREHLHELRDFLTFVDADGEDHVRRWEEYRDRARAARAAASPDRVTGR